MTRQIIIKLNEKKYRPLLDKIKEDFGDIFCSNSEFVQFALWNYDNNKRRKKPIFKNPEEFLKAIQRFKKFNKRTNKKGVDKKV